MACPITITKFIGTFSLGLLTGHSFSTATVTIPYLTLLPTADKASRALSNLKRLNRKHALRLANVADTCVLFAYSVSPRHRKHPYLIWMCVMSTVASYGVDYWFHREIGFTAWVRSVLEDTGCTAICGGSHTGPQKSPKKEDDIVVVEPEEDFNGESVKNAMRGERNLQLARMVFSGLGFAMGIVGLWGDRK